MINRAVAVFDWLRYSARYTPLPTRSPRSFVPAQIISRAPAGTEIVATRRPSTARIVRAVVDLAGSCNTQRVPARVTLGSAWNGRAPGTPPLTPAAAATGIES